MFRVSHVLPNEGRLYSDAAHRSLMVTPPNIPVSTTHYTRDPRDLRFPADRFLNTLYLHPNQNEDQFLHSFDKLQTERERERERERGWGGRDLNLLNNTSVVMGFVNIILHGEIM